EIAVEKIKSMDMNLNTIPLNNLSYDDLIKNAGSYGKDSIILFTTYYSDVNGKIVEYENVSREVSKNSSVPVYHLYDMGLNNGAFGGSMTGGKVHGESAANLAISILGGENPDNIPVLPPTTARKVFDFRQLERFNISLSNIPKDIEIINKPFSFFETYKTLVLSVLAAFIILLSFVFILLFYIAQTKRIRKSLAESHEELTQTYEELAASDEELQQQFEEIVSANKKIKETEGRLAYLVYHDSLTGLPNKLSLYESSHKDIFLSQHGQSALLFIDMDNFKYINDTMGHVFGDQLIIKVSERLNSLLKDGCSIYRLSGDEFTIIIQHISGEKDAETFAAHLLEGFKEGFDVLNCVVNISLSIGIAMYPAHGENIEELLKHADISMYRAKETGRNRYVVYNHLMNKVFTERMEIEKYLHTALEKNEFEIYYQPQLDLKLDKITGFEALLRWKSPELGFVSPLKFIKIAEDTRLIILLGTWVLRNACVFLKKLHKMGFTDLTVSVNISMLQLIQRDFSDIVKDTLEFYELEPYYLELEITESILMESFETIELKLEELSECGVRIALDDFGKGYSSLSYLKQLPISTLKIDKSFIDNITNENNTNKLTGHIVTIGKSMGMCVVAEGVERQEQLEYLIMHECDKIQGYLYSKPVPEAELIKLVES
ncbi:MAG TPA: EAL domain-containing protein, partial [Patescibacteria group bacterium]|nr:EAL domain-containing protein [Patescibacteria group bacterium]